VLCGHFGGDVPASRWAAHAALWDKLAEYADHTRYRLGLGGVPVDIVRRRTEV
jgi:hypothetical protein